MSAEIKPEKRNIPRTSIRRRNLLSAAAVTTGSAVLGLPVANSHAAENWPSRPVRIVVPFGAGSASDIHARMIAEELQSVYKQPFIVDNKPGANSILGAEFVAKAAPDGYTLLETTSTVHSINPATLKNLPYHPTRDFTPIARLSSMPFVFLVRSDLPVKNMQELVAYASAGNRKTSHGYGNATGRVAGAALVAKTGIDCVSVAYRGTPAALSDLLAGQITFMTGDLASAKAFIESQKVRPIAVLNGRRSSLEPGLPTVAESLSAPEFDLPTWLGIVGPAGMQPSIVQSLNERINAFLTRKEVSAKLASLGAEIEPATPQEFERFMAQQLVDWRVRVRNVGIEPE